MQMKKICKPENIAFVKIDIDDRTVVWIQLMDPVAGSGAYSVRDINLWAVFH